MVRSYDPVATTLKALPRLSDIEEELLLRGIWGVSTKAIPADSLSDLPALSRIASRLEPSLRRLFIRAVRATRDQIALDDLAAAIANGSAGTRLAALAQLERFERRLAGYEGPLRRGFLQGSAFANQMLTQAGMTLNFNLMNTHAAEFSQTYVPSLVRSIRRGAEETIQGIITDAVTFGDTPQQVARRIRRNIGFTARDAKAYREIEKELEASGLPDAKLERMLERVANGFINRRAKVIARTEIIRATNGGQQALWDEAVTQGLIDRRVTKKRWLATDDELLEPICRGLDAQDPIPLDEEFMPGVAFPPQHPNCRCAMVLVFEDVPTE